MGDLSPRNNTPKLGCMIAGIENSQVLCMGTGHDVHSCYLESTGHSLLVHMLFSLEIFVSCIIRWIYFIYIIVLPRFFLDLLIRRAVEPQEFLFFWFSCFPGSFSLASLILGLEPLLYSDPSFFCPLRFFGASFSGFAEGFLLDKFRVYCFNEGIDIQRC